MKKDANLTEPAKTARCVRGALSMALVAVLYACAGPHARADTAPKTSGKSNAAITVDPRALELLARVKSRLRSIRTLSAVCTQTQRRLKGASPSHTAVLVRINRVRLMRPNFTRMDEELRYQKVGEKSWQKTALFRTEASDGRNEWTVYHVSHEFSTWKDAADGHSLPFRDLTPLDGFFDPENFILTKIDILRKEGLLRSLTLRPAAHRNGAPYQVLRLVRLVYQRVGSQIIETEDYSIGADLLIHRIQTSSSAGEFENTVELSRINVDAPMAKSSFAYSPPDGTHPRQDVAESSASLLAKGAIAPDIAVQDAQGAPLRLADYRGKWVILDFWATWCGSCVQAFPHLNALAKEYKDRNVVALAISVGDSSKAFQAWLPEHKDYDAIRFAIDPDGIDGKSAASKLFHADALPTQYLIDPTGKIVASILGYDSKDDNRLAEALKSADPSPVSPPPTPPSP